MNLGRENETVEFKEGMSQLDDGILALTAMLNRHNRGTLHIGVADSGDVIGMDIGGDTKERIRNRIRDLVQPQVVPEIGERISDDGRRYISVSVTGHDIPYSFDGRYYIRDGASDESAGPDVLVRMVMSRGIDPLRALPSDDRNLTFTRLSGLLSSRGIHPLDVEGLYQSRGMIDERGRYNMTAYLVSDQNAFPMQVVRFNGKDRTAASSRTDFGGRSLLVSARDILDSIGSCMETGADTSEGTREETPLFDSDSFREAWINACVHNSWRAMIPPSVMVFDDRLEVVSYGTIPFPTTLEDFFNGDSRPVNTSLFGLFTLAGLTEQSGHGVPTIVRRYGREAFHITDGGVVVTIPFAFEPEHVRARREGERLRAGMDPEHLKVLSYLESHPEAKLSEVADYAGMSLSSVKKAVSSLKADGHLRNDGTNRNSRWTVL